MIVRRDKSFGSTKQMQICNDLLTINC